MSIVNVYLQLQTTCLHQKTITEIKLPETEENVQQDLLIQKGEKEDKPSLTTFFFFFFYSHPSSTASLPYSHSLLLLPHVLCLCEAV